MKLVHVVRAAVLTALLCAPVLAAAYSFEGPRVNGEVGYSFALTEELAYPEALHGAAARIGLGYGFNEAWGGEVSIGLSWFETYRPYTKTVSTADDGTTATSYEAGPPIERTRIQDLALGVVYAFDVYRVTPTISVGVATTRGLRTIGARTEAAFDLSIPVRVALDLEISRHLSLGVLFHLDNYLLDRIAVPTRGTIAIRATFRWFRRNLGHDDKSR